MGYAEEEVAGRCAAILANGKRCPNASLPGSRYCGIPAHQELEGQDTDYLVPPEEGDGGEPEEPEGEEPLAEEEPVAEEPPESEVEEPAEVEAQPVPETTAEAQLEEEES
jgi:transcription termination/antitermination protein NusA